MQDTLLDCAILSLDVTVGGGAEGGGDVLWMCWLQMAHVSFFIALTTFCSRESCASTSRGNWRGWMRAAFSIAAIVCILSRSGDIEMNPGPECEFVPQLFCRFLSVQCNFPVVLASLLIGRMASMVW
jgi:hypothetical protein